MLTDLGLLINEKGPVPHASDLALGRHPGERLCQPEESRRMSRSKRRCPQLGCPTASLDPNPSWLTPRSEAQGAISLGAVCLFFFFSPTFSHHRFLPQFATQATGFSRRLLSQIVLNRVPVVPTWRKYCGVRETNGHFVTVWGGLMGNPNSQPCFFWTKH